MMWPSPHHPFSTRTINLAAVVPRNQVILHDWWCSSPFYLSFGFPLMKFKDSWSWDQAFILCSIFLFCQCPDFVNKIVAWCSCCCPCLQPLGCPVTPWIHATVFPEFGQLRIRQMEQFLLREHCHRVRSERHHWRISTTLVGCCAIGNFILSRMW